MKRMLSVLVLMVAAQAQAGEVAVSDVWSRATAPGQTAAMMQAVITSNKAGKLVAVSCDDSKTAELHSMVHEGGMMKMRQVDAVDLPAGKAVDLGRAGYHLMLIGLKKPLVSGEKTAATLTVRFDDGKEELVKVVADVKPLAAQSGMKHMQH